MIVFKRSKMTTEEDNRPITPEILMHGAEKCQNTSSTSSANKNVVVPNVGMSFLNNQGWIFLNLPYQVEMKLHCCRLLIRLYYFCTPSLCEE